MLFEKELFHNDNLKLNGQYVCRKAVRAVILKGDNILLVYSGKNDEYKFPGGGINENETAEEALIREVKEEIGINVTKINGKVGTVAEYSKAKEENIDFFKMISEYYLVDIENKYYKQNLDEYEKELLFEPQWIRIEDAERINRKNMEEKADKVTKWIKRETYVLGKLKELNDKDSKYEEIA
jgi:8-oxo-dGTP pyrophosphatase MutT (NUDIX family)